MPPSSPTLAALGSSIVGVLLLFFGYGLAGILLPSSMRKRSLQYGLAFPSLVAFGCTLMIFHMLTGGAVLASAPITRVATGLVAGFVLGLYLLRRRRGPVQADVPSYLPPALVVASWILWAGPLLSMIPVGHVGDQMLHMGWAAQLMNGAATPSSGLEGDIPNYYPWLFHALVAWVSHLTPGGRAFHGQSPLLLVQLAGSALTLLAIGRQLAGVVGGAAAALFGALSGGFGWLKARGADLVFDPRAEGGQEATRYLGDLLYRRSYNSAFHNLVPVFPRDVAYVLLYAFLLLATIGLADHKQGARFLIGSGVVLGLIGLTGGETFAVGFAVAVGIGLCHPRGFRLKALVSLLFPALVLSSMWLIPLMMNYVRLGGFVNTASPPVTLRPLSILGGWGIVTPFALVGLAWTRGQRAIPMVKATTTFLIVGFGFVALCWVFPWFGGAGFTTLGRPHRYWPLVHIGTVLFAALGASHLLAIVCQRSRYGAVAVGALTVAVAIPSSLLGSVAYSRSIRPDPDLSSSLMGKRSTVYNQLARSTGELCTAAVPYSLSLPAFAYSGYQFVLFPMGLESSTQPRVRYRAFLDATAYEQRLRDNRVLIEGFEKQSRWLQTLDHYGVDRIVTKVRSLPPDVAPALSVTQRVTSEGRWVIDVNSCG